jgi:hypothetical protein
MLNRKPSVLSRFITTGPIRWIFTAAWGILLGILIIVVLRVAYLQFFFKASADETSRPITDNMDAPEAPGFKERQQPAKGMRPHLEVQKIVPYGRSLEVIGRVEAGAKLRLNNERVEVTGDGMFRHFTKQFPISIDTALLELKATDLAGRTHTMTKLYTFGGGKSE